MTFALVVQSYISFDSFADEAEGTSLKDVASSLTVTEMKNGSVNLLEVENPTVTYGDYIDFHMNWEFDDDTEIEKNVPYTYELPDVILFKEATGDLTDGSAIVGTYKIKDNTITITYTDLEKKFTEQENRKGGLTFRGQIFDDGDKNPDVNVKFEGTDVDITVHMEDPDFNAEISIRKYFSDYDSANHIYRAYVRVTSFGNNTEIHVNDELWPGMKMISDPVVYYDDDDHTPVDTERYTYNKINDRRYTMDITSMPHGDEFYLRYEVEVDPDMYDWDSVNKFIKNYGDYYLEGYEGWISSKATVYSKEDPKKEPNDYDRHISWADITTIKGTFSKWSNPPEHQMDKGLIAWQIPVFNLYGNEKFTEGKIVDTFPKNTSFVEESFAIVDVNANELPLDEYAEVTVDNSGEQDIVTINFTKKLMDYLKENTSNQVAFKYLMKVDKQESDSAYYTNTAKLYYNGEEIKSKSDSANYTKPETFGKDGEYNESTAPYANYEISVNPASLDLDPQTDDLLLTDTMSSSYDLDVSSVKINGESPEEGTFTYDSDSKTMTINLKDSTAYKITYRAKLDLIPGTELSRENSGNTARLTSAEKEYGESATTFNGSVHTSAGSSSSDITKGTLSIVKHDENDATNVLSGAEFSLDTMSVDSKGNATKASGAATLTQTTNSEGKAVFERIERGKVFMLKETAAPENYVVNDVPKFIAFEKNDVSVPDKVKYEGKEYEVYKVDAVKMSDTVYVPNSKKATPSPTPSATPTSTPTASPTAKPTGTPSATPTSEPTGTPSATPTSEPTGTPSATPTSEPTGTPSATPTSEPTGAPSATPTSEPTGTPSATPTSEPTGTPSATPTSEPTGTPSATPTSEPTGTPSATPTSEPTGTPTASPSAKPTSEPTGTPSATPTSEPTSTPTVAPTDIPIPPTEENSGQNTDSSTSNTTEDPSKTSENEEEDTDVEEEDEDDDDDETTKKKAKKESSDSGSSQSSSNTSGSTASTSVKTGDNVGNGIIFAVAILMISMIGLVGLIYYKRKRKA